jgi:hypothetical protein
MTRTWPIIAVKNVGESATWYTRLLDANNNHPGATVFDQILDTDGTVLLCLHQWGPSGARGDHQWASLAHPANGQAGNGLLLWFVVDDLDSAWERAQALDASIVETPNTDNGTSMRAFVVRVPDGYQVAVNEAYR